jgi:hypothetical protein
MKVFYLILFVALVRMAFGCKAPTSFDERGRWHETPRKSNSR